MTSKTDAELPGRSLSAIGYGGPMDGQVLGSADVEEFEVVTADRSRWTYRRSGRESRAAPARGIEYDCLGRR